MSLVEGGHGVLLVDGVFKLGQHFVEGGHGVPLVDSFFFTDAFVCVPQLSPDLQVDYESYKWTKLNPDNEADKKTINDYFRWEGDFGGKKFNQGKIFK